MLPDPGWKVLLADTRHHLRQQEIAAVRVAETAARREVQCSLSAQQAQCLPLGPHIRRHPAREVSQCPDVPQTAGVIQQLAQGNAVSNARQLRHVPPNLVLEGQLTLCLQHQYGGCGELLGDRAGIEGRASGNG